MRQATRHLTIILGTSSLVFLAWFSTIMAQGLGYTWNELFPTGTPPTGRHSAGAAPYDEANDRLILFGGADSSGLPRPTDVWVLINASGAGGTPSWIQLAPMGGPPLGREGGTTVYDPTSNSLIVHGGCAGNCSPALSDVWVLSNANGMGGTPTWTQLPSAPIGRAFHNAVYDPGSNRMIIFGGNQAWPNTDLNDVWVLTNANGSGGTPQWVQLAPTGTPPASRSYSAAVYDQANNHMIIFGGLHNINVGTNTFYNDVWVLTHANGLGGTPQWIQLSPNGTPPALRSSSSMVYDPSTNRIIVFGGGDDQSSFLNDVWILSNANGLGGTPQWIELMPDGGPIPGRVYGSVGYLQTADRMIVAMGRNDTVSPSLFNDVWVLQPNLHTIFLPIIFKPEPVTYLNVTSVNTGGINPLEIRDPNNGNALLLSCIIDNNVTQYCGSFNAVGTYTVIAYTVNCGVPQNTFSDALPGATVTRAVICN